MSPRRPAPLSSAVLATALAAGCGRPGPEIAVPEVEVPTAGAPLAIVERAARERSNAPKEDFGEFHHEPCPIDSDSAAGSDLNGDGRPDVVHVRIGGRDVCRALDLDGDGSFDEYTYFDARGDVFRRESDVDYDGNVDSVRLLERGTLLRAELDLDGDGRIDTREHYEAGRLIRRVRDRDADGRGDQWWTARADGCLVITSDEDGDGYPDKEPDGSESQRVQCDDEALP